MDDHPLSALLVEDNRLEARRIQGHRDRSENPWFQTRHVTTLHEALALLDAERWDILPRDLMLPDSGDIRTVRRAMAHAGNTPVVVLTNAEDRHLPQAALQEGAQDFLRKVEMVGEDLIRVIRNTIERQELHSSLQRSEQRWRRANTLTPDPIWILDPAGTIIFANEALCDLLRLDSHEVLGHPVADFVSEARRGRIPEIVAELVDTGWSRYQTRALHGDGSEVPLEVTAIALGDGTFHGLCRDMTAWVEAEQALATSEARYASILSSAEAIITVNREQRIVLFNHAAEVMFGVAATKVIGKALNNFIPQRFHEAHHQHVEAFGDSGAAMQGMSVDKVLTGLRADGREFPIEANITHLDVDGEQLLTAIVRDVSEREAARRTVRAMSDRFRALTAGIPDLIAELSESGRFVFVSPNYEAVLGYTPEALLGTSLADLLHPDDQEEAAMALDALRQGGRPPRSLQRYRHRNGAWRWVETTLTHYRTDAGDPRTLAVSRDETERVEMELQLRESENRNRMLLNTAPDPIWIVDASLIFEYVNDATCTTFQQSRIELTARRLSDLLPPDGRRALEAAMAETRTAGVSDFVSEIERPDGTAITAQIHLVDLGNGTYQGTARDVTAWVSAERAREASVARYREALDQATDGIWFLDADDRFTYVNGAACAMLGQQPSDLLGRGLWSVLPESEHEAMRVAMSELRRAGEASHAVRLLHRDGEPIEAGLDVIARDDGGCQAFVHPMV